MRIALQACVVAVVATSLIPQRAQAFTIKTGFTESCHEQISVEALGDFLDQPLRSDIVLPSDDTWRKLSTNIEPFLGIDLTDEELFVAFSLFVGVRAPDTDGHSVTNLDALRRIHANPVPEAQYRHTLRALGDDGIEGNVAAVEGAREEIRKSFDKALDSLQRAPEEQLGRAPVALDFYNRIQVDVWEPAFRLAEAMHTVQDSFAHTIRSEADDLKKIATVLNYVDAISTDFNAERDGLAHSDFADQCAQDDVSEIREAARQATLDLLFAFRMANSGDDGALESFLDEWVTLVPGCTPENEFCDNAGGLAIVEKEPTGPYLPEWMICSAHPDTGSPAVLWPTVALLLFAVRRRLRRPPA